MKKNYFFLVLICTFFMTYSFGQTQTLKLVSLEKAVANKGGGALSMLHNSPDIGHEHDGQPCLASPLTADWIERAGISDDYRREEAVQSELVRNGSRADRATYTIPVIFHVIYNTDEENVSEEAINALLDAVNEDFSASNPDVGDAREEFDFIPADADIEFCLAKQNDVGIPLDEYGIHRVETVEIWFDPSTETNKMKSSTDGNTGTEAWDRDRFLNVWICDLTGGGGVGVAGYAYKPTYFSLPPAFIDGIVLDYNLGMPPERHILTHEIGHFLGLDHTWGGGDTGDCFSDDDIDDTPNTAGPSIDFVGSCTTQETCPGIQTQYENFMDFADCRVMFTEGQKDLMHLVLDYSRAPLAGSEMCEEAFPEPPITQFEADITAVIIGGAVNFTDLSDNYPTEWSWEVSPGVGVTYIGGTSETSQNPVIQFDEPGYYTITLDASNLEGSDEEIKVDYIEAIDDGLETAYCDTARNYNAPELENATFYPVDGESGYYPAQLTIAGGLLQVDGYAERFNAAIPTELRKLRFPVYQADDIGEASDLTFRVWSNVDDEPGEVLGTQIVPISDLITEGYNYVEFSSGIPVSGDYWVGVEFDYTDAFDTVIFATTDFDDRPSDISTTSLKISDGVSWTLASALFLSEPDCSLIIDVLTSLGSAPVAIAAFPEDETCEGMEISLNGFGSLNTTDYNWNITNGIEEYNSDEGNLITTFDEGVWTISLTVNGSCDSDESEEFTLSVNPPMELEIATLPENCNYEDGEISFTASGGDDGPYNYSIDGGVSFLPSGTFTDLIADTYYYIVKDDSNCELEDSIIVDNEIIFFPTISPDITIDIGASTDLAASGGVSYAWYAGADFLSAAEMISVSPVVTTTYDCFVANDEGCIVELNVTVTVNGGIGIKGYVLENGIHIYPNPSTGIINLQFELEQTQDISIQVVNLLGDEVISQELSSVHDQLIEINLQDLATGIYYLILQSEGEMLTKKLLLID